MGFSDIFSSAVNWLGGSTASGLSNLASAGFDIYGGIQSMNASNALQQQALAGLRSSQALSDRLAGYQEPLLKTQAQYSLEDLKTLRPLQQAQLQYGLTSGMSDIDSAKRIDPLLRTSREQLIGKLTEGEGNLRTRLMSEASADVGAEFTKARGSEERRLAGLGITPQSGAAQSYGQQASQAEAAARAAARTQASRSAEDTALGRQSQALNLGMGIPLSPQQYTPQTSLGTIAQGLGTAAGTAAQYSGQLGGLAGDQFGGAVTSFNKAIEQLR